MNLDLITYGNPTQDQIVNLSKETFCDVLFDKLIEYKYPKNSSEATIEELNAIVDALKNLNGKDAYINRYKAYDISLKRSFIEFILKDVEEKDEIIKTIESIQEDINPLMIKLKYYFQRPRPYQLAEYYKLKLFPYSSISANSPSFPSGHSYQARIITEVIGNLYPQTYGLMQKIFDDICYSRLYLGLHYQSDIDVGIFCADKVLALKEFKAKYKL
mgnify:CR=1 FL=1|tara:strand:+ start:671 stop:1318 length:648 start_codon:yes stop_codon:yes gene_type:complete